jgi:hypothetical protein
MDPDKMRARFGRALRIAGDLYTMEDIVAAVQSGQMQAWSDPEDRAFIVTQIGVFPRAKILDVSYLAGELDAVMSIQPRLVEFARVMGCKYLTAGGRRGWAKVLPKHGWKEQGAFFRLDVGGGNA